MSWIFFTVFAAFMQTGRNALQSSLSKVVNTSGVTLARFLFAGPLALCYLTILYYLKPSAALQINSTFISYVMVAAIMQIVATALMVKLFKCNNFAIGAGLAKSEAVIAAIFGALFFSAPLSILGWFGVLVGAIAIFMLSIGQNSIAEFSLKTAVLGIGSGSAFALTSLSVREAAISLELPVLHSAAWVLVWVICIQTLLLLIWIGIKEPVVFSQLKCNLSKTFAVSLTSFLGSVGWFTAMSLTIVPYVKTLGQVEVLFTILLSTLFFKHRPRKFELWGLMLISLAAILVILS